MKLILQREQLLKPLQLVIGAVDQKQAMPILSNVLLCIDEKKLSITGTDLEIELIGHTVIGLPDSDNRLPITDNHKLTLPARKLYDICKALPENAPIELYQEHDRVILKSNRIRFTVATLSPDEFPAVESAEFNVSFMISQKDFSDLLRRTAFAMAQQDVRYYLNGMLMEITNNSLRVVATDGHRLAMNQIALGSGIRDQGSAGHVQIILPYRGVAELMRLLKDDDETLTVEVGHHHIRVFCDDFIFTSKLVEGRYPDYQRVIPKMGDKIIEIDRDLLKQALMRTAVLCHDKVRSVRLELESNCLRLSANNMQHEVAEEELEIHYQGESLDVGFNITYLLDILNTVKSDVVRLVFVDSKSSLRIDEPNNHASVFVVMPMV